MQSFSLGATSSACPAASAAAALGVAVCVEVGVAVCFGVIALIVIVAVVNGDVALAGADNVFSCCYCLTSCCC